MDMKSYEARVMAVDWDSYSSPKYEYYRPESAPEALMLLAQADEESYVDLVGPYFYFKTMDDYLNADFSKSDLLMNSTVLHNVDQAFSGLRTDTYCPVIKGMLPFIIEVSLYGNHAVARNTAINLMIDLHYYGAPDAESEGFFDEELYSAVQNQIEDAIRNNRDNYKEFFYTDKRNESLEDSLFRIVDGYNDE